MSHSYNAGRGNVINVVLLVVRSMISCALEHELRNVGSVGGTPGREPLFAHSGLHLLQATITYAFVRRLQPPPYIGYFELLVYILCDHVE